MQRTLQCPTIPWKVSPQPKSLFRLVRSYTLVDPLRLAMLYSLACEICENGVAGDLVECGVYNGGSAAVIAAAVVHSPDRRIWLYDTFSGIPAPGLEDGGEAQSFAGQFVGSTESVQKVLMRVKFPLDRAILRKGPFQNTFREPLPEKIALLHIDADWYDSVLAALQTFYPAVVNGGLIILDDFGHWEGARKAFYTFCRDQSVEPLLERVGYTQAFWRKGCEHNRDVQDRFFSGVYHPS